MPLHTEIYQHIISAKLFIDEHFHERISLRRIAMNACMSRFHFHRIFTQVYNVTPHRYLTSKRMNKAKDLLCEENLTITEVCNRVGFESLGSFSTLFKKEIGFPPQYYRNMAWQKKQQARQEPLKSIPGCFVHAYGLQ